MNGVEALREQIDLVYFAGVACIVVICLVLALHIVRYWADDMEHDFRKKNELRIDEEYKRRAFVEKPKRLVRLSSDGELLEVISDESRSETLHESFHDESPYQTPSPDLSSDLIFIPFSEWDIDDENDNDVGS